MTQNRQLALVLGVSLCVVWTVMAPFFPWVPSPWPPFYWALPVHGQVVDAETGTPVSGVIVVAQWELKTQGWSPRVTGQAAVMEEVTDNMGRFTFRWWRPRLRWFWEGHFESDRPALLFFKSGYKWEVCADRGAALSYNPFPGSDCDGAIIKLKKFQGSEKDYAEHLSRLDTSLSFATGSLARGCEWRRIPRMITALQKEKGNFKSKGIPNDLPPIETMPNQDRCGSAEKFLRCYLP